MSFVLSALLMTLEWNLSRRIPKNCVYSNYEKTLNGMILMAAMIQVLHNDVLGHDQLIHHRVVEKV